MRNISACRKPSKIELHPLCGVGVAHQCLNSRATLFLNRLVEDPKRFFPYARLYASSVAAVLAWGFRAKTLDSFWFKDVSEMIEEVWWLINFKQPQPLIDSIVARSN